jgi:DNA-binding response OmpR family regulator
LLESPQGEAVQLTATESTLLKVMCDSPKHVFSRTELLRTAFRSGATDNTVDTYVSYIRQKTTHDLILTVRGKGYMIGLPKE